MEGVSLSLLQTHDPSVPQGISRGMAQRVPNVLGPPAPRIALVSQGWNGFAVAGSSHGCFPCFSKRPPCVDLAVFAYESNPTIFYLISLSQIS